MNTSDDPSSPPRPTTAGKVRHEFMRHAGLGGWPLMIGGIALWLVAQDCSAQEPKERAILKGHVANIPSLAFSADGKMLVSGSWDTTIRVWDVASDKQLAMFKDRPEKVWSVAITEDCKTLASGSNDGAITIWNVATGKPRSTFKGDSEMIRALAFSSDGKMVGSGD